VQGTKGLLTLARSSPQVIMIINAVASDGCCGHAFCIYNNLIYDSAEERAMPMEQHWLDRVRPRQRAGSLLIPRHLHASSQLASAGAADGRAARVAAWALR
jgi:hypothetical protein